MAGITINEDVCKGCGLCAAFCPKGVIALSKTKLNRNGYFVAECVKPKECIGCAFCATMCPDIAITVER